MWKIDSPIYQAGETFSICISRIRDAELRGRLEGIRPNIEAASLDYQVKASDASLHLIEPADNVAGSVTGKEMKAVYELRMAKKEQPGRQIYDKIQLLPKNDRCPYCDQRNVSILDHVLPKAHYA